MTQEYPPPLDPDGPVNTAPDSPEDEAAARAEAEQERVEKVAREHVRWTKGKKLGEQQLAEENGRRLVLTWASEMEVKIPKWLWDWRVPHKAITLLAGREGIGKSTYAASLIAAVTRGKLRGRHWGKPASAIVVATEDTWNEMLLPRLIVAGADLSRVARVDVVSEEDQYGTLSLPADLRRLEQLCVDHGVALVVCDPLMSLLSSGIDTHKDADVRKALTPLRDFADRAGVAVLGLIHLNKSGTTDPLNAVMASRAFTAAARSVLFAAVDPEDPELYLLGHPKSNLGPKQPTLTYRVQQVNFELEKPDDDGDQTVRTSRIVHCGEDTRSTQDVLEQAAEKQRKASQGETANELYDWIAEQGRVVSAAEVAEAFPAIKRTTVDKNLSRLVGRGLLVRPLHGHYAIATSDSDTEPDISSRIVFVSDMSEVSGRSDISDTPDTLTGTGNMSGPPGAPITTSNGRGIAEPLFGLDPFTNT